MNIFIFNIIWIIWFISEILLNILNRSGDKKSQDKGSHIFIWVMIALAISTGIILSKFVRISISSRLIIPYIGLFIIVTGIVIRFSSIWTLGRLFTVDVTIRDNHKIKKDGLYKVIRHPSYSGALLSFIGFGLTLNNWLSLIAIISFTMIAFLYRIKIEENTLIAHFGNEYLEYMKKTYRLIPWIY